MTVAQNLIWPIRAVEVDYISPEVVRLADERSVIKYQRHFNEKCIIVKVTEPRG